ncbi:ATP-binding protein [Megasphaera sp. DISK 18]|uniref:ATP-binding protein n=1 Tax=Megasphaera sp. DISK 18 TaxID=1776081 RepID=UPI00080705D6|nr:ATP-binding protein [Megasphaera sp. DISK 18]OBZ33315.1 ATP/GTP-binding protein [Megasphaera sp. DISK 18]
MYLTRFKLKNFRGYQEEVEIEFNDLTAFVGKNDCGKSTILEALDIFFNDNKGTVKIDRDDLNITATDRGDKDVVMTAYFKDFPESIVIDATNTTNLKDEYLLNENGELEIQKIFPNASTSFKTFILANHPQNPECNDLLYLKSTALKKKIKDLELDESVDMTKNAEMRNAIWNHYRDDLELAETPIDLTKEDAKKYWSKISTYLPIYSLFQADRNNSDSDDEVQDPLRNAVKEIVRSEDLQQEFNDVAEKVLEKLNEVAARTLDKLKEMDEETAETLKPAIPAVTELKWADVFKNVSIAGDEGIPLNKRGSGVRRLILLNFFRAEAARKLEEQRVTNSTASIIYAIEEPETSQHFSNQLKLVKAFKDLSALNNVQIILTTHSGVIVKNLTFNNLRLIDNSESDNGAMVKAVQPNCLPYPSLNEVNYVAFDQINEEYHDELYGYLELNKQFDVYKQGKATRKYKRVNRKGETVELDKVLSEYIRHQIHHPENNLNPRYTQEDLVKSISDMRDFIKAHKTEFINESQDE